ncbi:C40 family peptidase [Herminiimonas sp.]|uniref:C40 family peptidase n=1 Tax=Herminiimonas sp. TaxID=1926289 RepID=UPI00272629F4|nr:C40 family peptidase [Herminiimonas sp.]MDO8305789.1 C40 family peptidase [Herminiimonas sp.]
MMLRGLQIGVASLRGICLALLTASILAACGTSTPVKRQAAQAIRYEPQPVSEKGNEVALYAMGMIDTGYQFGGKNPEAGLDCSGMVSYIYRQALDLKVSGSAADIARRGKEIDPRTLRPGDLVFFNTLNRPFSHVGVYIGDGRFIHAPSSKGKVRIERMDNRYFASRFEMARTYFD